MYQKDKCLSELTIILTETLLFVPINPLLRGASSKIRTLIRLGH
jgi:hypothetical protein